MSYPLAGGGVNAELRFRCIRPADGASGMRRSCPVYSVPGSRLDGIDSKAPFAMSAAKNASATAGFETGAFVFRPKPIHSGRADIQANDGLWPFLCAYRRCFCPLNAHSRPPGVASANLA